MIRRIAVLTGDDEAPGMNAALRAVTRTALEHGWEVMGICDGYAGLMAGEFITLTAPSVDPIIQQAGTLLDSFGNRQVSSEAGQKHALHCLADYHIDALIVIGGIEAQTGAYTLSQTGFPVNGIAASVENDLSGFDLSLGVDTALNAALARIDHAKVTKTGECSAFFIEVAGRKCGYLAVATGIAGGATAIVAHELTTTPEDVATAIQVAHEHGGVHPIVVVAEGATHRLHQLTEHFAQQHPQEPKPEHVYLGHIQRHSAPSGFDRLLGTRLGAYAVDALARGVAGVLVGPIHYEIGTMPLAEAASNVRQIDQELMQLADMLTLKVAAPASAVEPTEAKL